MATRYSKTPLRGLGVAVVAMLGALIPAGCGGTRTIDASNLEAELRDQLADDVGARPGDASVSCPDDIEAERGREFECTMTAPNIDEVRVEVTLTDDEGGYRAVVPREQ